MARKKDHKRKPVARKTDSKDTVTVAEQIKIVEATMDAHTLDVIESADNRPSVRLAINIQREEIAKAAKAKEPVKEDKFPNEELSKIEKELAPVAEPVVKVKYEAPTAELVVDEPAAPAPVFEEPAKPEPIPATPLAGGVLGSLSAVAEDEQEIESQKSQARRAVETEAKLRNPRVAAHHARADADRVLAEAKRLEGVARGAEARAAEAEAKAGQKPKPAPVEAPKAGNVEGNQAPAEAKSETSGPPNALL